MIANKNLTQLYSFNDSLNRLTKNKNKILKKVKIKLRNYIETRSLSI